MKLINSLKSLVTEAASLGDVQDSIKKRKVVTIYYDGNDNGGKGYRTIEGSSWSASNKGNFLPGWRLFRLDKIFTYQPTMDNFVEVRPKYNPNGDRSMERVLINAKFDNIDNLT